MRARNHEESEMAAQKFRIYKKSTTRIKNTHVADDVCGVFVAADGELARVRIR